MKVEYVKPFAQASYDCLKEVLDRPITRGSLSVRKQPVEVSGVAVIIGLIGDIEGRVLFDMSEDTAIKIAAAMNYEEFNEFHQLARATISELGNIIAGRAVSELNNLGYKFNITPPILIRGNNMESTDIVVETLVIPLISDLGTFNINLALKNGKKSG